MKKRSEMQEDLVYVSVEYIAVRGKNLVRGY